MHKEFTESNKFDGRVNEANNRISGVSIITTHSKNNRRYKQEALESIVPLVNDTKSFLDHAYSSNAHSVMDLLGVFSNARIDKNVVRADLTIFESSKGKDLLFDLASNHPGAVGFSIAAKGLFSDTVDSEGREVCEKIIELRSIDCVAYPASTTTLWESQSDEISELQSRIKDLELTNRYLLKRIEKLKSPASNSIKKSEPSQTPRSREQFWRELDEFL